MNTFDTNEYASKLQNSITVAVETIRPNSLQAKVLETMLSKSENGLPRMTYDLEVANKMFEEMNRASGIDFSVPDIWRLIAMDVSDYDKYWDKQHYAENNHASIKSACYNLRSLFANFNPEENNGAEPIELYFFNPQRNDGSTVPRDISVITPFPDYRDAALLTKERGHARARSTLKNYSKRLSVMGNRREELSRELAKVLIESTSQSREVGHMLLDQDK